MVASIVISNVVERMVKTNLLSDLVYATKLKINSCAFILVVVDAVYFLVLAGDMSGWLVWLRWLL